MNYREYASKRRCLTDAVLWTAVTAVWAAFALVVLTGPGYDGGIPLSAGLAGMNLIGCGLHWYRYLAYDRKKKS